MSQDRAGCEDVTSQTALLLPGVFVYKVTVRASNITAPPSFALRLLLWLPTAALQFSNFQVDQPG
jgi:hypothetical protein